MDEQTSDEAEQLPRRDWLNITASVFSWAGVPVLLWFGWYVWATCLFLCNSYVLYFDLRLKLYNDLRQMKQPESHG